MSSTNTEKIIIVSLVSFKVDAFVKLSIIGSDLSRQFLSTFCQIVNFSQCHYVNQCQHFYHCPGSSENRSVIDFSLEDEEETTGGDDESDIRILHQSFTKETSAPSEIRGVKDSFGRSWSFR